MLTESDQLKGGSDELWPGKNRSFKSKRKGTNKQHTHTYPHTDTHTELSCSPPSRVPWELPGEPQPLHQEYCKCPRHPTSSTDREVPVTSQRAGESSQLRREGLPSAMEDDHPLQQTGGHCSGPLPSSEDTKNVTGSCPEHHHETCTTLQNAET